MDKFSVNGYSEFRSSMNIVVPEGASNAVTISRVSGTQPIVYISTNGAVGISTCTPGGRLDVVAAGSTPEHMNQLWRRGDGVIVGSMSATGVLKAVRFEGDGSGLVNVPAISNTATDLAGGAAGYIPYQAAVNDTVFLPAGSAYYLLQGNGVAAPVWVLSTPGNTTGSVVRRDTDGSFSGNVITANSFVGSVSGNSGTATMAATAATATNLAGGLIGYIPYQSAVNSTTFLAAGTAGYVLTGAGAAAPVWTNATNLNTVSSIVRRDAAGNFTAGTISAGSFVGSLGWSSITSRPVWMQATNLVATLDDANTAAISGFYEKSSGTNYPTATGDYYLLNIRHAAIGSTYGMQITAASGTEDFWTRTYSGGSGSGEDATFTDWKKLVREDSTVWAINISSNAATATTATNASNITGGAVGALPYQSAAGTTSMLAAGTAGYMLTAGAAVPTWTNSTSANTAGAIVQRDASGNFAAGTISATSFVGALSGNAATASVATNANACSNDGTCDMTNGLASYYNVVAGNGYGLRFWSSDTYKIHMGAGTEYYYGPVSDYSIKMNMGSGSGRGFTWGSSGSVPIAALNATSGNFQIAGTINVGGIQYMNTSAGLGSGAHGISWYSPAYYTWFDYMSPAGGAYAPSGAAAATDATSGVTSWARRFNIENLANYGWIFESGANTSSTAPTVKFSINSNNGNIHATGSATIDGSVTGTGGFVGNLTGNATTATTSTNSDMLDGLHATGLFNSHGENHGVYSDFNAPTDFGFRYIGGTTNGPGISGAAQYYNLGIGLGANYPYTSYAMQFAIPRTPAGGSPYPAVRFREAGTWGSWSKIYAGYADTAAVATTATTATTATNSDTVDGYHAASFLTSGVAVAGDWNAASSVNGTTGYTNASLELRESNFGGSSYTSPRLAFHWGGVVASQIGIESSGRLAILDNPGTGYENLIAKEIYATSWLRTTGTGGWYSEPYGGGWYMADSAWIRSYGDKNIYQNTGILRTDGVLQVGPSGSTFIATTGGNVGVGVTSPQGKLDVNGSAYFRAPGTSDSTSIFIQDSAGTNRGAWNVESTGANSFYDFVGSAWHKSITLYNGNVGIGTTNPAYYKLTVSGDAQASNLYTGSVNTTGSGTGLVTNNNTGIEAYASETAVYTYGGNYDIYSTGTQSYFAGNVGIGNTAPSYPLDVTGGIRATGNITLYNDLVYTRAGPNYIHFADSAYIVGYYKMRFNVGGTDSLDITAGKACVNCTNASYTLQVNGQPAANGYTAWTNYSDRRLKENIADLPDGTLDKLLRLKPASFNYNDKYYALTGYSAEESTAPLRGFVAQEIKEVFPDMVHERELKGEKYYDTNLSSLPVYTLKGVQELARKGSALESMIKEQQKEIEGLKQELKNLKK